MRTKYLLISGGAVHCLNLIASIQVPREPGWDRRLLPNDIVALKGGAA